MCERGFCVLNIRLRSSCVHNLEPKLRLFKTDCRVGLLVEALSTLSEKIGTFQMTCSVLHGRRFKIQSTLVINAALCSNWYQNGLIYRRTSWTVHHLRTLTLLYENVMDIFWYFDPFSDAVQRRHVIQRQPSTQSLTPFTACLQPTNQPTNLGRRWLETDTTSWNGSTSVLFTGVWRPGIICWPTAGNTGLWLITPLLTQHKGGAQVFAVTIPLGVKKEDTHTHTPISVDNPKLWFNSV